MADKERLTAKKVRIVDVVNGKFFSGSREEMKPSYIITPFGQKISRVNLIASVTDKFLSEDENYCSITVDDGTEAIRVKTFRENVDMLKDTEPGDMVLVIGKIKEYNNEVYINGEIIRKVDVNYEILRKVEILKELIKQKKIVDEIKNLIEQMTEEELKKYVKNKFGMDEESLQVVRDNLKVAKEIDYKPKILELISSLDEGSGVEISKIFELSDLPENVIENAINELLSSGDLFEPSPGKFKRVI
jgi:RPA family protein